MNLEQNLLSIENQARSPGTLNLLTVDLNTFEGALVAEVYGYGLIAKGMEAEGARILKALSVIVRQRDGS